MSTLTNRFKDLPEETEEIKNRKSAARKISSDHKASKCYCGGIVTEWKIIGEIYLQCDRCQLRTTSYGDSVHGKDLLYHAWNNKPKIKE